MSNPDNSSRGVGKGNGTGSKRTQFVKGKSGNLNGRGKGVRNFATEIEEELDTNVPATENGTHKRITKRKAVAKQLVNKAASGDAKAIPILLNEMRRHETRGDFGPGQEVLGRPEDKLVMANIVKRIREAEITTTEGSPESKAEDMSTDTSKSETEEKP